METDIEKLIYVLMDGAEDQGSSVERIAEGVVSAARSAGAERLAVLVPDYTNEIRERCAGRLGGAIDRLSSVFECWVPSLDSRGAIEEALSPLAGEVWGYLVTESTLAECPHAVGDGAEHDHESAEHRDGDGVLVPSTPRPAAASVSDTRRASGAMLRPPLTSMHPSGGRSNSGRHLPQHGPHHLI